MLQCIRTVRVWVIRVLEYMTIIMTAALVLDVVWQVFTRFILQNPSTWTEELATLLLIWVSLLGAALAFHRKGHLGVDYFVGKLPQAPKRAVEIIVHIITAAFAVILIFGGLKIVSFTLLTNQLSAAMQIPMGYVYIILPLSGGIILLLSVESLLEILLGSSPNPNQQEALS